MAKKCANDLCTNKINEGVFSVLHYQAEKGRSVVLSLCSPCAEIVSNVINESVFGAPLVSYGSTKSKGDSNEGC